MATKQESLATTKAVQPPSHPPRPTISLPPRPSAETFFAGGGLSPGPMTLVSSFFSTDNYFDSNFHSFSQLLAGAMASPRLPLLLDNSAPNDPASFTALKEGRESCSTSNNGSDESLGFKGNRPMNLAIGARSPLFTVPPGLSPSGLFSPGFFSPQSPFGMSHQQALAQVTAQAALAAQSQMHMQAQIPSVTVSTELLPHHPSTGHAEVSQQQMPPSTSDSQSSIMETLEYSRTDRKHQLPIAVDKPNDDNYNWRKYGQKPIKGCEYPRSYYRCTYPNCPVKKKIERSSEGQITEIIYRGQHNHEPPPLNKRARDGGDASGSSQPEPGLQSQAGNINKMQLAQSVQGNDWESTQADPSEHVSSDSEEAGDTTMGGEDGDADGPNPKKRNVDAGPSEIALPHKTVTEPKIIVQTRSEVDLLDDGYRWRKYGQKVVKGNPHPRSYYKCTSAGCNVRKHVERAAADPKAVITAYEGKHNHLVPGARNSSHNTTNTSAPPVKPQKVVTENHPLLKGMDFGNNQRPILVRLKEEEIAV